MKRKSWSLAVIIALLAGLLVGCGGKNPAPTNTGAQSSGAQNQNVQAPTQEKKVIKVGTNKALGTVTPYVARNLGSFEKAGLKVEITDFQDGSTLMEAFAAGNLDVAYLGIAPAAIWANKGVGLKVVASANGGGHVLITREDAGIKDVASLKGKKVATPKPGTVTDTLFRTHILKEIARLDPEKDLKIIPGMAPADMSAALVVAKEVDAAITWEPFATQAQSKFPGVKVLYDAAGEWKKENPGAAAYYPVNVVIARQSFMEKNPEELKKYLQTHRETTDFINGKPQDANAIISKELNLDVKLIEKARERVDYTWKVDVKSSLETLKWSKDLGYLKEIPAESKLFNLDFIE